MKRILKKLNKSDLIDIIYSSIKDSYFLRRQLVAFLGRKSIEYINLSARYTDKQCEYLKEHAALRGKFKLLSDIPSDVLDRLLELQRLADQCQRLACIADRKSDMYSRALGFNWDGEEK